MWESRACSSCCAARPARNCFGKAACGDSFGESPKNGGWSFWFPFRIHPKYKYRKKKSNNNCAGVSWAHSRNPGMKERGFGVDRMAPQTVWLPTRNQNNLTLRVLLKTCWGESMWQTHSLHAWVVFFRVFLRSIAMDGRWKQCIVSMGMLTTPQCMALNQYLTKAFPTLSKNNIPKQVTLQQPTTQQLLVPMSQFPSTGQKSSDDAGGWEAPS